MAALTEEEALYLDVVKRFVDQDVKPVVQRYEHADAYPEPLIGQMKELGVFGLAVPEPYNEAVVSTACLALVTAELARGWMSLAGAFGSHAVVSNLIARFGTTGQQERYLPRMITGACRAAMALTEPQGGSDLQAIRTVARSQGDGYVLSGTKTWISNARHAGVLAVLAKTDPQAEPAHRGMSVLLVEPGDGVEVSAPLGKLGYKGVESCEVVFHDVDVPSDGVLGGPAGEGFSQMMTGLELGRIQVASRALGVGRAALDDALRYSQERETFGRPIWRHQAIGHYLADMATKLAAAQALVLQAAATFDAGDRSDHMAGMAKLFASETAQDIALQAMRIHGAYGYSTEYDVERYYRDTPLMIIGEGTNEIQKNVIVSTLIRRSQAGEAPFSIWP